ncbi:hypothetical protein R1sor_008537 [Riccia sorocarpa]|uniref:Uncharacterized protein n=1 Tax=Riccia sorocarpa TaxID=122646 RepID=A0ABD3HXV5_9MARC
MDPEDDPEDRLDFAELMVQSLRREVLAVRGHLEGDTPERYMYTFVAIPLTWIFIHLGIITGEECDALPAIPAAPTNPSGVEAALKKGFEVLNCLQKSLVVRPGDCLVHLLELLQKRCHIIVWSRASLKYVTAFLGLMVSKGYLPAFMLDPQVCTLWGGDGVETVHPRRNLEDGAKMKSFRRLYDHGICLRVLSVVIDVYGLAATWSENLLPTVEFVRSYGHVMDGLTDPLLVLREFWGETPQPVDRGIIWGEVPSGRYLYMTTKWPDFYFHRETAGHPQTVSQESPAEEARAEGAAPVEETVQVEEAPVEEAAPVKEPTRVEEAPAKGPARVEEATRVEEAPAEEAARVEEATRVEEAPAEGAARVEEATPVEEAPAVGLTHE